MAWIALLARLLLAIVFLIAAVSKLADRQGSRQAVADFGVPNRMATPIALVLPPIELAIAVLLIPSATARWGAIAALGLLGLFTTGISISLARGRRPDCHCFGQLHSAPIGWSTLVRNILLGVMAGVVLWRGGESLAFGSIAMGAPFGAAAWIALAVALIALALAAVEAWFILNLLPQQGRILVRLERVEKTVGLGPGTGLPIGELAPEFELRSLDDGRVSLAGLRSAGRPVLLSFMGPLCAPCDEVMPELVRWQREHADRVTVASISHGSPESNRVKAKRHGVRTVLLQKEIEVMEAYDVIATPAAVLVSADGRIASRVGIGAEAVEGLLQQALTGVPYAPLKAVPESANGNPQAPESPAPAISIGQPAPALALPDLDGKTIDLASFQGTSTLVLFWSPTCGFCQQMLSQLKKWERQRPAGSPELLVVSSGTVEENRVMGLASPVVLDSDGSAMRAFGADGTPMAVLVDADGMIASAVVVGAQQVMALARTQQSEPVKR